MRRQILNCGLIWGLLTYVLNGSVPRFYFYIIAKEQMTDVQKQTGLILVSTSNPKSPAQSLQYDTCRARPCAGRHFRGCRSQRCQIYYRKVCSSTQYTLMTYEFIY